MKRKIFTLLMSAFLCNMAMAQAPEAVAKKTETLPVIDGMVDGIWLGANTYNIATPFQAETPTLGETGTSTWKALWSDDGIYILLTVNDNEFYPAYMNGSTENWLYDKPEIYFDVNEVLKDGLGAKNANPGDGHWQVAPGFNESELNGEMKTDAANGVVNAFLVTGQTYRAEYFVPFAWLKRGDGTSLDVTVPIGFDVTICDGESAAPGVRQRANWSNSGLEGAKAESWANMDDCGTMTFSEEVAVGGALIMKTEAAPAIDGEVDAMWDNAPANNIVVPFKEEAATVGEEGETTWKALWNDAGVYILVQVADDEWLPFWGEGGGANGYEYDKLEIYFDSNSEKKDGLGGQTGGTGHVQVAPDSKADGIDGTMIIGTDRMSLEYNYAIKVTAPTYVAEYFVPWDMLTDKDGSAFDKTTSMGFDITVIDRDPGDAARKRVNWSNAGAKDENWNNMDDAGLIMFDGAVEVIYVDKVVVSGGTAITTDGGTLQMVATVDPVDASSQTVKWVVENGTGKATISSTGLLTAIADGTVLVKGIAKDAYAAEGKVTVTISGQKITLDEINYLKNGNFDKLTETGGAVDWPASATVVDGELVFGPTTVGPDPWSFSLLQRTYIPFELKDEEFFLSFKAWADEPRTLPLVFEDAFADGAQWDAYASSTDAGWSDKTWTVDLTTEPQIFNLNLNFAPMQETTQQNFNFQVGMSTAPIHLDSIYLVRKADLALVSARSLANAKSKVQLYPNPVQNELTISKIATANSKVSVYNAVGQKLMEKTANGTQAKFDVASLKKGMYFVRFSDGTSEKFLKQ